MAEENRCEGCGAVLPEDSPSGGLCAACLMKLALPDAVHRSAAHEAEAASLAAAARIGQSIGPYRLERVLGEGGMGIVYLAHQEQPIRRQVALKVIKLGMDSRDVLARFAIERRALELMDHAGVARVLDAGVTAEGQPYFAMEYVKGEPITKYCDRERLTTRQRLDLLVHVCEGVQHAHQKGIIHRDIKPSNVLVTMLDGRPVPKIIDFGVAKATEQLLTEKTLFTRTGVLLGTPEYMSPEQAEMTGVDVDTRTDVYSLGVLLYEVLVGALPFDATALREAGFEGLLRKIREENPPRPSTRVSSLVAGGHEAARLRRTDPGALSRRLRGELDWIVMKALEKDRGRRYSSVEQFAEDIRHYLHGQPVMARSPTFSYQARKFIQRNRLTVTTAAVVILLVGTISAYYAFRLARERRLAESQAARATRVSDLLKGLFEVSAPGVAKGREITARELLDQAAVDLERGLAGEPEIQAEMSDIIGDIYRQLGLFDDSDVLLERALRIREERFDARDPRIATTLLHLGQLRLEQWKYEDAQALFERALWIVDDDPNAEKTLLADILIQSAITLNELSSYDEGQALLERAVSALDDTVAEKDRRLADARSAWGYIDWSRGDLAAAADHFGEALKIRQRSLGEEHWQTGESYFDVATAVHAQGRLDEARPFYETAVAIYETSLGSGHTRLSDVLNAWAVLERQAGNNEEAERMYLRSAEINRLALGENNEGRATALTNLSKLYVAQQRLAEAEAVAVEALAIHEALGNPSGIAFGAIGLAEIYTAQRRMADAEPLYVRAIGLRKALNPISVRVGTALLTLGEHYRIWGRYPEAEPLLLESLEVLVAARGEDDPLVAITRDRLARVAAGLGNCPRAMDLLAQAGDIDDPPEDDADMARCRQDRGAL